MLGGLFDSAIAAMEDGAREMEALAESEDAPRIAERLRDSVRDQKTASQALDLRKQGAVTHDLVEQVQRMHRAILHVSEASHSLNKRQQELIARDLLARDMVTLGDVMAWAQQASVDELADAIASFVRLPFPMLWGGAERQLIEAGIEVEGKQPSTGHSRMPKPLPVETTDISQEMSEARRQIFRAQAELRQALGEQDPMWLPEWVDRTEWDAAVTHFIAATDPDLWKEAEPIYLTVETHGTLTSGTQGAVGLVTEGELSLRETIDQEQEPHAAS